jgi:hypothetical protein
MGAKELLEEQRLAEEAKRKLTSSDNNNGAKPSVEETEVTKIKNQTAKIQAEIERNNAQQILDAQNAGFVSVATYKQGVEQLSKNMTEWVNTKALERSQLDKEIAESAQKREQLQRVHTEIVQREKNVTEREKLVGEREAALGKAQQIEFQRLETFNSDIEVVKRNYIFLRNRIVRIINSMTMQGIEFSNILINNLDIIDRQAGKNNTDIDKNFAKLLPNLKIISEDTYNAITSLLRLKKHPDCSEMVKCFRELSENEVWKLIKPPRWIED